MIETSSTAVVPKNQFAARCQLGETCTSQVAAHFHLDPPVCSTAGFHQDIPSPVVAGDHISTILADDCMVTDIQAEAWGEGMDNRWTLPANGDRLSKWLNR